MSNRWSRTLALVAFGAATLLLAALPAAAQNPYRLKPGAMGKVCLECHSIFEETLALANVHTPVENGECSGCHDPHASNHGQLLAADTAEVCLDCHAELLPQSPRSAHEMVVQGDCVMCHDPHASEFEGVLLAGGNELCGNCHDDLLDGIAAARFKHAPVDDGCATCHDPHATADTPFLLREDVPGLCIDCHDVERASFTQRHMGYPVGEASCSSCHDPHGSDSAGMLWASVHRPVTTRMCNQCHEDAASPEALQTKATGVDLCRGCHSGEVNTMLARNRLHWPLADRRSCEHCHSPHASKQAGLLPASTAETCGTCHTDTLAKIERATSQHAPVADGDCTSCHSPHSSDRELLLVAETATELCATCHDWEDHSTHPIGEDVIDTRNGNLTVDCLSCHLAHGANHSYLSPYDPASELCVNCHETFGR